MAGSGVALRLHEFKEGQDSRHQPTHVVGRQGRDVLGLYPGQIGRVHTVSSHLDRLTPDTRCNESRAVMFYQRRQYDLWSLQASLLSTQTHTNGRPSAGAGFQKFTLTSHPEPLEQQK